jgi:O-antigen/teichoic acid export membrane protein
LNLKSLLKDSIVYGVSKYFGVFAAIFLTPIYTRILTKADYGVLDIFSIWSNLVVMVLPLGLIGALVRFYPDFEADLALRKKNIGSIFISLIVLSFGYIFLMMLIKPLLFRYFFIDNITDELYYLTIFIVVGEIFKAFFLTQLQVKFKKYSYLLVTLTGLIGLTALGFVLVYFYKLGVVGFFRASLISLVLSLLISIIILRKDFSLRFDWNILKSLLSYSAHLLSASFFILFANLIDRYLILEYFSLDHVGVYSIGVKISGFVSLTAGAFTIAWFPIAMRIKDSENAKLVYKKVHNLFFTLTFPFLSVLFIFRNELIAFFAPTYQDSYEIIAILSLYIIVNTSIFFYTLGLHIMSKTKFITLSVVVGVLVNILVSVVLLNYIGIEGIAYGTLISTIVSVAILYYYSNKYFPVNFNLLLSFSVMGALFLLIFITPYIDDFFGVDIVLTIILKCLISIAILALIYLIGIRNRYNNLNFE